MSLLVGLLPKHPLSALLGIRVETDAKPVKVMATLLKKLGLEVQSSKTTLPPRQKCSSDIYNSSCALLPYKQKQVRVYAVCPESVARLSDIEARTLPTQRLTWYNTAKNTRTELMNGKCQDAITSTRVNLLEQCIAKLLPHVQAQAEEAQAHEETLTEVFG